MIPAIKDPSRDGSGILSRGAGAGCLQQGTDMQSTADTRAAPSTRAIRPGPPLALDRVEVEEGSLDA